MLGLSSVCGLGHSALQFFKCVCVERRHPLCAYIKLYLHQTRQAVRHSDIIVMLYLLPSSETILALASMEQLIPVVIPPGYRPCSNDAVGTTSSNSMYPKYYGHVSSPRIPGL